VTQLPLFPQRRIVVVGGPRCGKSTYARQFKGVMQVYCGDPRSKCTPESGVVYLPEELGWSESSAYVTDFWLSRPGPWVMEGQVMARALRKWEGSVPPCDEIVVFLKQHPKAQVSSGHAAMHKGVMTVWDEISHRFAAITTYR